MLCVSVPSPEQQEAHRLIGSSIQEQDGTALEAALMRAFGAGLHPSMTSVLNLLCVATWHARHEDVVRALQKIGDASSVEPLEKAAHAVHEYLDYDEFFGLARKCTWALADIGGTEARNALERLATSKNEQLAKYAHKRLHHWTQEAARKRG
jgi:hypothetical protein